ncbi:Tetratricopeptide repeat [Popillia japonica]|uniref:Tetratricopeptide repeat n=1 Tax=Popillia japonica TaxID=7064 RepID=A0AAW1IDV3_POPJA
MYEKELYSNIIHIVDLALSSADQKQDTTPIVKFQLYIYYGDSHFHLQQYLQAEQAYTQALQIRKFLIKTKNNAKISETQELTSEVDVRYKMHLCYIYMKQPKRAFEILQNIPTKAKTAKINMALGNLCRDTGLERQAIGCYKEVLREIPMAVEAAENLLKLGVKGIEINSTMLEATSELGWLNTWLKGHAQMHSRDFNNALTTLKSLDTPALLQDNCALLITIAYCYLYMCDTKNSITYLQRAFHIDPHFKTGRDLYASLLAMSQEKENLRELERLLNIELDTAVWPSEQWVVVGYNMYVNKKYDKAAYFGQQAYALNRRSVEAFLLKAYAFMQLSRYIEAVVHFREAKTITPNRFEAHKGAIDCYIALNRVREAITTATNLCTQMNNNPHALTLYASVIIKEPTMTTKTRDLLEFSLIQDPSHLPAIWLLAELLEIEQKHEEAYTILSKHVKEYPNSRTHQLLADCLLKLQREEEAFNHYSQAIRLDPSNQRAVEGLNNIGRSAKMDSSYYISVVGESSSFASQDPSVPSDDVDVESDSDIWPSNSDFMNFD